MRISDWSSDVCSSDLCFTAPGQQQWCAGANRQRKSGIGWCQLNSIAYKPVVALVGRANVGKSTLFNRITRSRAALVADFSGLTRDRHSGEGRVGETPFIAVDTGGDRKSVG